MISQWRRELFPSKYNCFHRNEIEGFNFSMNGEARLFHSEIGQKFNNRPKTAWKTGILICIGNKMKLLAANLEESSMFKKNQIFITNKFIHNPVSSNNIVIAVLESKLIY